jgi:N-acyl-L-homoserine lactone synthetase
MIDCVNIATAHYFAGTLIAAQHRLRYQEVVAKENWSIIYVAAEMEFDRYDNVATEYFIARDAEGKVRAVCRSYPTTIPYMLSDVFSFLCSQELPRSHKVHEASRLVLDRSLLTRSSPLALPSVPARRAKACSGSRAPSRSFRRGKACRLRPRERARGTPRLRR